MVVNEIALRLAAGAGIDALLPNGYAVVDGMVFHDDQWDGYPAEQARVARWMRDRGRRRVGATLVVSGDVHSSWAFDGPTDPDGATATTAGRRRRWRSRSPCPPPRRSRWPAPTRPGCGG